MLGSARQLPGRDDVIDARWRRRSRVRRAHRGERASDSIAHGEERNLRSIRPHRPGVRRAGRDVGKITAQHPPPLTVELQLDVAAEHQQRRVASAMHVTRHRCPGSSRERHELVDVGGFRRPCDSRHHLTADQVVLALFRGKHVHPTRARKAPDDRDGLLAADLDGVEDLVRHAGQLGRRHAVAGLQPDESGARRQPGGAKERAPIPVRHGSRPPAVRGLPLFTKARFLRRRPSLQSVQRTPSGVPPRRSAGSEARAE
jgi:hypothetical protein